MKTKKVKMFDLVEKMHKVVPEFTAKELDQITEFVDKLIENRKIKGGKQ